MNEREYQSLYRLFHAFAACDNKAAYRIRAENQFDGCSENRLCYTSDGACLYLCDDCLTFWQECRRLHDRSMWDMAVFLRESRAVR